MEIKISFDTEKESIDDLKKLIISLQDLIAKREKASSLDNPLATSTLTKPSQVKLGVQQPQTNVQIKPGLTNGGSRVIPYEDMSGILSKIVSGKKY